MSTKRAALLEAAHTHAKTVIAPNVDAWNAARTWPRDAADKAGAAGLTGLYAPEEFGGQGLPLSDGIQVYEQLGIGDGAYAFALSMHNICTFAGCGYGTDAFKKKWARDLTAGRKLANFALTEPQSGSDPMQMYTRATINGDGTWTISGAKAWVSLASEADVYFTVVKTSDAPGHKDMAMIAIPADAPGLSFGPKYETPSYNFLPMSEMYLDGIQWMLGEVATDLEASKLLYRKAAAALGTDEGPLMAAHAKRFVPDAAVKAANTCTQVLGGMGLLQPYGLDRLSRLAQMLRIVDGTTEISRVVIGRALKKRAASLPDLPIPQGFGEKDPDTSAVAAE